MSPRFAICDSLSRCAWQGFRWQQALHKVHLQQYVPARDSWSFTLYDNQTRAMLQTDQQFPGVDNHKPGLQQNKDSSYDVYIGPKASAGKEPTGCKLPPAEAGPALHRRPSTSTTFT